MANAVKTALGELFTDVSKSKSGLQRLLKPSPDGAGSRVFPSMTAKNDGRYGVRIDKGEPVKGKDNIIRLKLQINSNASNKTLRDIARKDSHRVIATADVDWTEEVSQEKLEKVKQDFLDSLDV
ncbi:MAG: hypothetical protein Q9163_002827 [Psora crenata]